MIEWLFNRGNFMKIKDKRKIFPMILIFLIVFLLGIMINNKVYGSYGEQFWKFLVTRKDSYNVSSNGETKKEEYTVIVNGKTSATFDNKTYEIPYALNFNTIVEFVNSNCKDKKGNIDNSKVQSAFDNYCANELEPERDEKAVGNTEINNYNNLFEIMGRVKVVIMNKKSVENLQDALKRDGIISESYNSDGTINKDKDKTFNSSPTKEELLNYNYTNIYHCLNNKKEVKNEDGEVVGIKDVENMYWDGKNKACRIIDDNSNLSDADKKEIKLKWAEEVVKNSSKNIDANVKDYLYLEINAVKDKRYYRNPNVNTTDSSSGLDDAVTDADDFINTGDNDKLKISSLQVFSRNIYNILLTIGIAVAVLTGAIIGIKYMLGSVEEKADIKGLLIPYIAGCVIIFGSFAIWKLVVTLLQGI